MASNQLILGLMVVRMFLVWLKLKKIIRNMVQWKKDSGVMYGSQKIVIKKTQSGVWLMNQTERLLRHQEKLKNSLVVRLFLTNIGKGMHNKGLHGIAAKAAAPRETHRYLLMKIIFDSNIYDKLAIDIATQEEVRKLVDEGKIVVIVTRTIFEELSKSPFKGIPSFFKIEYTGNTVGRCGIMCAGDSIGAGTIFDEHLGGSKKLNDALIADASDWKADYLVSEDDRLQKRMRKISHNCAVLSYSDFVAMVAKIK